MQLKYNNWETITQSNLKCYKISLTVIIWHVLLSGYLKRS